MGGSGPAGMRIGEVARRTGVSVATLRAWETRYGFLQPTRTPGGQRLYRDGDVARVRRVLELVERGWLVSAAVDHVRAEDAPPSIGERPPAAGAANQELVGLDRPAGLEAIDPEAAVAAYRAVRAMLNASRPADVRDALVELVVQLGGSLGPAETQGVDVIPIDLSCGEGAPLLPRAAANTLVRARLEAVLPGLVEDARSLLERLHPTSGRSPVRQG